MGLDYHKELQQHPLYHTCRESNQLNCRRFSVFCQLITMTMKGSEDKGDQEETWQEFYEENRIIPPHRVRLISSKTQNSFPFCLTLKSIDGIAVPSGVVSNLLCVFVLAT